MLLGRSQFAVLVQLLAGAGDKCEGVGEFMCYVGEELQLSFVDIFYGLHPCLVAEESQNLPCKKQE